MSEQGVPGNNTLQLFIVGEELTNPIEHAISTDRLIAEIVEVVIAVNGHVREEVLVFREDDDEPLPPTELVAVIGVSTVHTHRCRRIVVSVNYQDRTIERKFSPAATIHRVRNWAVGSEGFKFSSDDAVKFELALPDEIVPSERDHVGQFARHGDCAAQFDLVEADKPQG